MAGKGLGIAGFVLSLLSILFLSMPFLGLILAILGLIFCIIQLKKKKTGLAIAGLVISIVGTILGLIEIAMVIWIWSFLKYNIVSNANNVQNMTNNIGN